MRNRQYGTLMYKVPYQILHFSFLSQSSALPTWGMYFMHKLIGASFLFNMKRSTIIAFNEAYMKLTYGALNSVLNEVIKLLDSFELQCLSQQISEP